MVNSAFNKYIDIKTKYNKLMSKAAKKYSWDDSRFVNLMIFTNLRKDKEVERYLGNTKD